MTQDLSSIPFHEFSYHAEDQKEVASKLNLQKYGGWIVPRLVHWFSTITPRKNATGKYCAKETFSRAFKFLEDKDAYGRLYVATELPRGCLIKHQASKTTSMYGALTPLPLAGFKLYHGIAYESWDKETVNVFMGNKLFEAASCASEALPTDEILRLRELGLLMSGKSRKPESAASLYNLKGSALEQMPQLTRTMITQTWLACPSLRHELMILNPSDWDNMPEPLISEHPLTPW